MTPQFTIKDKFTMPPAAHGRGKKPVLPLRDMTIGQTMIVDFRSKKDLAKIRSAVGNTAMNHKMRFMTRTLAAMPEGKIAIQRVRSKSV